MRVFRLSYKLLTATRGAWVQYSLNEHVPRSQIDVFLLDERYERDNLPCHTRRDYCTHVLNPVFESSFSANNIAWCEDFLISGSALGDSGSCCARDEQIFMSWCKNVTNMHSEYYRYACDVTYMHFGQKALVMKDGILVEPDGSEPLDAYQTSPFCDVLGRNQMRWLRQTIAESAAPLKVIVSGSVLFYDPLPRVCSSFLDTNMSSPTYGQTGNTLQVVLFDVF
jgi:hypothetical protein